MSQPELLIRCSACAGQDHGGRVLATVVADEKGRPVIPRPHRYGLDDAPGGVLRWSRLGVGFRYYRTEDGSEEYEVVCDVFASAKQHAPGCYAVWRIREAELAAKYASLVGRPNREALAGVDLGEQVK